MSGYFSRIAKQSGVRFSKGGEQRSVVKKRGAGHVLPLDREETVMISPDDRSNDVLINSLPEIRGTGGTASRQKEGDVTSQRPRSRPQNTTSTRSIEPATTKPTRLGEATPPKEPVVESVDHVESERSGSSAVRRDSSSIAFSENDRDTIPAEPRSKTQVPVSKEKRQTDTANSEIPDKDFFERTSEILKGRETEPSTVQTILIQEVQEWIAAGRIPTDDIMADVDADHERAQPDEPQLIIERKPGVVRIGDRKPPDISSDNVQELSPSTAERINEQNFEISIGSISVVIEGDDPASQPAPVATPRSAPAGPTSPRTPRLSRHYL